MRFAQFLTAVSYYQRALELARELGDDLSICKWLGISAERMLTSEIQRWPKGLKAKPNW